MRNDLRPRDVIVATLPNFFDACGTAERADDMADRIAYSGKTGSDPMTEIAAAAILFGGQISVRYCQWWKTGAICHDGSRISIEGSDGVSWTHNGRRHYLNNDSAISSMDLWPYHVTADECGQLLEQVWQSRRSKVLSAMSAWATRRRPGALAIADSIIPETVPSMMTVIYDRWKINEAQEDGISKCQYRKMIAGL
jgi:hypothetical protein